MGCKESSITQTAKNFSSKCKLANIYCDRSVINLQMRNIYKMKKILILVLLVISYNGNGPTYLYIQLMNLGGEGVVKEKIMYS